MPLAVGYMIALIAWIFVACAIWCAACLMCVKQRTQRFAWPMSLAVATTFPFVFAYQIMAAPVVLTMMLGAGVLAILVDPGGGTTTNPVVIGGLISAFFSSTIITFAASIAGFADGWRTGWGIASGRSVHEMLSHTIPRRAINRLLSREHI